MGNNACSTDFSDTLVGCSVGNAMAPSWSRSNDVKRTIDRKINSSEILMVSKSKCPACKRAKQLFSELYAELGVFPTIVELDQYKEPVYSQIVNHLQTKSGCRTVPQIFFQGTFVGGNDDVQRLRRQRLLINKYKSAKGRSAPVIPFSSLAPPLRTNTNNVIRLSPVFMSNPLGRNSSKRPIRTKAILFEPTKIQHHMANKWEVKTIHDGFDAFSLSPPPLQAPSSSRVWSSRIMPRSNVEHEEKSWIPQPRLKNSNSAPTSYNSRYSTKPPPHLEAYKVIEEVVSLEEVARDVARINQYSNPSPIVEVVGDEVYTDTETGTVSDFLSPRFSNQNQFEEVVEAPNYRPDYRPTKPYRRWNYSHRQINNLPKFAQGS